MAATVDGQDAVDSMAADTYARAHPSSVSHKVAQKRKAEPANRPWQRWQRIAARVRNEALTGHERGRAARLLYCADKIDEWAQGWAIRARVVLPAVVRKGGRYG